MGKIKFIKGKHDGEIREVPKHLAEYFCDIRKEAIRIKEAQPKLKTPEREGLPKIPKKRK